MTAILAINAGSSSVKFGLFEETGRHTRSLVARGTLDDVGPDHRLIMHDASGSLLDNLRFSTEPSRADIFGTLLALVERQLGHTGIAAIGHRVVHGGQQFDRPVLVDDDVLAAIDRLTPLAPLHEQRSLEPVRALAVLRPHLPQVACFDTAFHHDLMPPVSRYAIPNRYAAEGIRKYGFHGLSYEFVAERLAAISPDLASGRTVVAHLGNGASLCAMRDGRSVDTSMGFSTLEGLVMGTRCGAIDPGIILYLQKTHKLSPEKVEEILYHQSGLLGISGFSGDMRILLDSTDHRAREAIELFTFAVARETAAMANTLSGLDCLVFTGGIGENAPEIRADICQRLRWLGVEHDPARNGQGEERIDAANGRVTVLVIPTDEETIIARHTSAVMAENSPSVAPFETSG